MQKVKGSKKRKGSSKAKEDSIEDNIEGENKEIEYFDTLKDYRYPFPFTYNYSSEKVNIRKAKYSLNYYL